MAHRNTILHQILQLLSRHEFESLANQHHTGQRLRKMTRWGQFVALLFGQLSGRNSLRDIIDHLSIQQHKRYHHGIGNITRSSLARVNEQQPATLYEALFYKLLNKCHHHRPGHKFRFKNPLYSLDASVIDLCLSMFPWADFRKSKGAIKLHVGFDHNGYLPAFMSITEGKCHEIQIARSLDLPKGSILAVDRGYTDYRWFNTLNEQGIFFVTRLKKQAKYRVLKRQPTDNSSTVTSDQHIQLTSQQGAVYKGHLRRIGFKCPETGNQYYFLTNNSKLAASTIAAIYKERWKIELFFKWIKQNLKIKSFVGTSKNAVLTQIWVAMCAYLLVAYLKFSHGITLSITQIARLMQLTLFERRELKALFTPSPPNNTDDHKQMRML
ncbi:IS4 family transposase [Spartinivicinus ruber]|uniref:IS4 family transposase n=1 Tax=Spartinivicinus ruber TaxID=2683272 RepID=UPI0013D5429D|nr:IS4 family transposase [Spartinivicinus ruber]